MTHDQAGQPGQPTVATLKTATPLWVGIPEADGGGTAYTNARKASKTDGAIEGDNVSLYARWRTNAIPFNLSAITADGGSVPSIKS